VGCQAELTLLVPRFHRWAIAYLAQLHPLISASSLARDCLFSASALLSAGF